MSTEEKPVLLELWVAVAILYLILLAAAWTLGSHINEIEQLNQRIAELEKFNADR